MSSFVERLPGLLRELADPTTPHTALEIWSRIQAAGWEQCVPVLLSELQWGNADVKRLVLAILCEEAEQSGTDSVQQFLVAVVRLLSDSDRCVRIAAVHAVQDFHVSTNSVTAALRRIVCHDEPPLARQALMTLVELDDSVIEEVASLLRGRPS